MQFLQKSFDQNKEQRWIRNILSGIGGIYLLNKLIQQWKNYSIEVLNFNNTSDLKKRYNQDGKSFALISDISNDYGKQFALQLAEAGFNLVLMAPKRCFDQLTQELKKINPKIEILSMVTNFKAGNYILNQPEYKHFFAQLDIAIVINTIQEIPKPLKLVSTPDQEIIKSINANVYSSISLTKFILPKMFKRNKNSIIVELANSQVNNPLPGYLNYAAQISFGYSFIQALANEIVQDNKIDLLVLKPQFEGEVSPQEFVRSALKKMGTTLVSYGHPTYYYQSLIHPALIQ